MKLLCIRSSRNLLLETQVWCRWREEHTIFFDLVARNRRYNHVQCYYSNKLYCTHLLVGCEGKVNLVSNLSGGRIWPPILGWSIMSSIAKLLPLLAETKRKM